VQTALLQMKSGAAATLHLDICFHGHDATGRLPRCPVTISIEVAGKAPPQAQVRVFSPPLATQRFALIRSVRSGPMEGLS
jgi:hypothetical protein